MSDEPLGLLVLDKPEGPTSHDAVSAVRRLVGLRRVGHAGTLDPFATGVLLVGVGRATRLLRFLQGTDKSYAGTLALGATTSTLDAHGEVTSVHDMSHVTAADVARAAASLTGELDQVPPMVSAVHHDGRRLHELAREGIEVVREPRAVRVEAFEVANAGPLTWAFEVTCSSGTYVRSLVDELGRLLGGGAHLATLRRTRVGRFSLDDAIELQGLDAERARGALLEPLEMVAHLGVVHVDAPSAHALRQGRAATVDPAGSAASVAVVDPDGVLVAVARRGTDGSLRPEVVMTSGGQLGDG